MRKLAIIAVIFALTLIIAPASFAANEHGEDTNIQLPPGLAGIKVGFLGYVDYSYGEFSNISGVRPSVAGTFGAIEDDAWEHQNRFELTRGYINIEKEILPWLIARATPDVTRVASRTVTDGNGETVSTEAETGDLDLRFKYYYLEIKTPDLGFFTNNAVKIGQQHFPYLDFLEHINPYRNQGTMFQERFNNFNSADMGLGVQGYFGGKVSEEYQKSVNHYYPGRWGSYHLAVMNGGGYHASEANDNKALEYRFTVRPLPETLTGLQLTYFGIYGKGNKDDFPGKGEPDWRVNTGLLSYQHELGTVTFEYARNVGEQSGADENHREGWAVFGMVKPPMLPKWRASAQYGVWRYNTQVEDNDLTMWRAGVDYSLTKPKDIGGCFVYAGYERLSYGDSYRTAGGLEVPDEWRLQVNTQIQF